MSRLDPALRKALLKALSNIEIDGSDEKEESTDNDIFPETTLSSRDEELLEESTAADLQALNLYNSYIKDGANYTQQSKDDNEIIHTFIVKAPRTTIAPIDRTSKKDDQVIIQFGNPDPVKDSDVQVETVQIARSVKTNEIDDADDADDETVHDDINKITTYKPSTTLAATTTTTAAPTTKAPTHNDEGENIEKVSKNDVKIYQAPLVAAFTVQQDALGLAKNIIPLLSPINTPSAIAEPIQEFSLSSTPTTTDAPNTIKTNPTFQPTISTTPLDLQLPLENNAPQFSLAQGLELPSTKDAAFTTFALQQKRRQLEEQIFLLQQQQREQEENFRQQQLYQEQQAFNRQQQLLLQQRYRFEEENRIRLQRYEQEQRIIRQQQQHQQQQPAFLQRFSSINQFSPQQQQLQSTSVQVIPSLSFAPVQIPTQQLLPVREPNNFRPQQTQVTFQPSQSLNVFQNQVPTLPQLSPTPQLPLRPAQPFNGVPATPLPTFQPPFLNNIDSIVPNEQSQSRNRVFRHESDTGNVGLNSVNTNFPPFFPVFNADSQLQNLLLQSGFGGGARQNEDLNIISKVLALNHGIQTGSETFFQPNQGRFVRGVSIRKH